MNFLLSLWVSIIAKMSLPSWSTESRSTVLPSHHCDLAEPVPRSQLCNTQQGVYFLCRSSPTCSPPDLPQSLSHTHTTVESLNEKKEGKCMCEYQWSAQSIMWVCLPGSCGAAECPLWLLTTQATSLLPMTFPVLLCGCSGSGALLNPSIAALCLKGFVINPRCKQTYC